MGYKNLFELLKSIFRFEDFEHPQKAFELALRSLATIHLSLGIDDLDDLIPYLPYGLKQKLQDAIADNKTEFKRIIKDYALNPSLNRIRLMQRESQRILKNKSRKVLAAYFTSDLGVKLMAAFVRQYQRHFSNDKLIIADPFMGSGVTLTETSLPLMKHIQAVWGIELQPLLGLVGFTALLYIFRDEPDKVRVFIGDSFDFLSNAFFLIENSFITKTNVVVTNPPFTRWENIDKAKREKIIKIIRNLGYKKYITRKQTSLHILSLCLVDRILPEKSLLITVLPASTFYTIYGESYKRLLKEKYDIISIIENGEFTSFSDDSGFKELILVATKGRDSSTQTSFAIIDSKIDLESLAEKILIKNFSAIKDYVNTINLATIPHIWDKNWLVFFKRHDNLREILIEILEQGAKNGMIDRWKNIFPKEDIVRGVEMYGPDFFLIPNRYWRITKSTPEYLLIENRKDGGALEIPNEYLVKTLRKPSLYANSLVPDKLYYFLAIPPKEFDTLPRDLRVYIDWGTKNKLTKTAERAFGKFWYSHVHQQLKKKQPYGHLFLPDKIDFIGTNRGVFANYSPEPLTATKNFYIIKTDKEKAKALAAWFNSIVFIGIFLISSRKISERWTRFLEADYLEIPTLNVRKLTDEESRRIEKIIEDLSKVNLQKITRQLDKEYRKNLDLTILEILKINNKNEILRGLYKSIKKYVK